MKKQIKKLEKFIYLFFLLTLTPSIAFAQNSNTATDILGRVSNFIGALLPVLISLGVIYFAWGVVQYVIGDSDEAKKKGRDKIIAGIIGLAVIVSLWGLVAILNKTLGIGGATGLSGQGAPDSINTLIAQPASTSSCSDRIAHNPKVGDLIDYVTCVIGSSVIPLIFALAAVMFIWGAVQFLIIGAGDESKRTQGKQLMIWGIIALTVMIGVWSLVKIVGNTFGLETGYLPQVKP